MSIHLAIFGKPRYLGLLDMQAPFPPKGTWLVVETMRGAELALLGGPLSAEQEARYRASCNDDASDGQVKGGEPILQEIAFARTASEEDLEMAGLEREDENEVLVKARALLRNHNLSMKLVDVEYLFDKKKLFFYFTSEQRVDFRAYVRDLAKEFKTRIELRQIGVRDEAKTVKGLAPCGRECCCSHWLHRFTPICIKMVKEQNLALNPTKISGICGRLMCCMSYEHASYSALWKSLPNPGSKIRTSSGTYIVEGVELSTDSVRVRRPEGGNLLLKVEDFLRFKETVMDGGEWEAPSRPLRESSSGRPSFESVAGKSISTRSISEDSTRAPRKKSGEHDERERRPDLGVTGTDKKTESKPSVSATEKNMEEKEKRLPESVVVAEEASKPAKKRRRRRKPSASGENKNVQGGTQPVRQHERGEEKPSTEGPSPDRPPKKQTVVEKIPNDASVEKVEGAGSSPEKRSETPAKRSSNSRRRRSGKGGNRDSSEKRNVPEQRAENPEAKNSRPSEGAPQRKQKQRPQGQRKDDSGDQHKEKGHE